MSYAKDVEQLIRERHSSRTYSDKKISMDLNQELLSFMETLSNSVYRFTIVDYNLNDGSRLGTYGMIKNAKTFIVAIAKKSLGEDLMRAVDFGYDFEKIVLKATDLGLDTCWMGMSYKQDNIASVLSIGVDEHIAMITPIGYSKKAALTDKIVRLMANANNRKPFGKVFFNESWNEPLEYKGNDNYNQALEMVRLGPSAGNAQPWRVVKTKEGYDFYVEGKKFYDNMKNKRVDFSYNDLGIAKLHFELVTNKYELKGHWFIKPISPIEEKRYVFSWIKD